MGVFATKLTVHAGIGAHDRSRIPILYRNLKSRQVYFAQGALVDDLVDGLSVLFLVVGCVMLGFSNDLLILNTANLINGQLPGKIGIFTEIFEVTAILRDPGDIHSRSLEHAFSP